MSPLNMKIWECTQRSNDEDEVWEQNFKFTSVLHIVASQISDPVIPRKYFQNCVRYLVHRYPTNFSFNPKNNTDCLMCTQSTSCSVCVEMDLQAILAHFLSMF